MAVNAGSVYSELVLDTSKFEAALQRAEQQMREFAATMEKANSATVQQTDKNVNNSLKNIEKIGKGMGKAGKALTKYVTLPVIGVGVAATKTAIDFESAFAGVKKTVDATDTQFAVLKKGIRDMSKEIPASATAIAGVAEAAGQLGIETENILSFTRVMIDLGEATNLSAEEAASSLAQFANITQMSQKDFDRLGATIVALGNNLATTEADIVNMAQRLAGAGAQIGLSEAQIMSFAGALSSVGIEAEAGGSAFSRLMVDMQLAVETGNERLKDFAKVAGMSVDDFKKAFQDDAAGALLAFIQGLSTAEDRGMSAIKILDDMGIKEIRLRDALLRAAGASDVFTDAIELGTQAWEENTALTKEAEQRYETTESKLQIMWNTLKDVGITIGEKIMPHLVKFVEKIEEVVEWFGRLDPATQETIIKIAGIAAAIGPFLIVGDKLISTISTIGSVMSSVAMGPVGLIMAAVAAGVAGFTALYAVLQQDCIPAVDLFGDSVSETTKEAVGGFLELNDKASMALKELSWTGKEVTEDMKDELVSTFDEMGNQIVTGLDQKKTEAIGHFQNLFANATQISEEEQAVILENVEKGYEDRQEKIRQGQARIKEILENASAENRGITREEQIEINQIQQEMVEAGIEALSGSALEQKAILESMQQQAGIISARQAADIVKNAIEQKEGAIAEAEEQYMQVVANAIYMRDELGSINAEQADKIIQEAQRQRDEAVAQAEDMHDKIIEQAKLQAGDHVDEIDWETGEVLSRWEWMKKITLDHWNSMADEVEERGGGLKGFLGMIGNRTKDEYVKAFQAMGFDIPKAFSTMSDEVEKRGGGLKGYLSLVGDSIETSLSKKFGNVKSDSIKKWGDIKEIISSRIEKAKEAVSDVVEKIKGFFTNLKLPQIKLPKIKLPHFNLTGSFSINPPRVPKLTVTWYGEGAIFAKPTVFNTPYGFKGVGEAGPEAVLPIEKLSDIFVSTMREILPEINNQGSSIYIEKMEVRKESDIDEIAYRLHQLQVGRRRAGYSW